jgi:hypothetical protein
MQENNPAAASDEDALAGFAHAVCNRSIDWVCKQLLEIYGELQAQSKRLFDHVRREPAFALSSRAIYVAPINEASTVIWLPENHTELLAQLSQRMEDQVPFVSAYIPMRCWYLLVFQGGKVVYEVYDPEDKIRGNVWTGPDLEGQGFRRFEKLADFLHFIEPRFKPVDFIWSAGRWENADFRKQLLLRHDCKFKWSLRIDYLSQVVDPVGDIPSEAAKMIKHPD